LITSTADKISETAKDLRPEPGDFKRGVDFVVDTTSKAATQLGQLGKEALKTGMAKDAAAGAAIGAVIAVPVPLIGPIAGAVIGAGLGVYKNIVRGPSTPHDNGAARKITSEVVDVQSTAVPRPDRFEELSKLHALKVQGVLTEDEFAAEKKKILDR
jgi:hypothetical protein